MDGLLSKFEGQGILPQHWLLQLVSWEELPAHAVPPQEGVGLVQDLKSQDEL